MKAQASVEMLVTIGMAIAFMVPVLLLLLVASQYGIENSAVYQAQSSSHMIADAINDVFVQGPGASKNILVNLPGSTSLVSVSKNEVTVSLQVGAGNYDAASPVFANASDTGITEAKGLLPLLVRNNKGIVEVSKNG